MADKKQAVDLKKIMIVDDDDFLINMYVAKFRKQGVEVLTAKTGSEALEKLRDEAVSADIEVVLLDIIMPDLSGLEVLEQIKEEELDQGKIVIFLTNQGSSEDIDRAKKLGVHGYIVKATLIPSEVVEEVEKIYSYYVDKIKRA